MKKIYLALVCIVSLVIMTACGNSGNKSNNAADGKAEVKKEAKAASGKMIPITADDFGQKGEKDIVAKAETLLGFKPGKPEGSKVFDAMTFDGNGERENVFSSYMIWFEFDGGREVTEDEFNAYSQAIWDACKGIAENGELFNSHAKDEDKDKPAKSLKSIRYMLSSSERTVPYRYNWYMTVNGEVYGIELKIDRNTREDGTRGYGHLKLTAEYKRKKQ